MMGLEEGGCKDVESMRNEVRKSRSQPDSPRKTAVKTVYVCVCEIERERERGRILTAWLHSESCQMHI